jgi:hypothetical protein
MSNERNTSYKPLDVGESLIKFAEESERKEQQKLQSLEKVQRAK